MAYLCNHGYIFSQCITCTALEETVEEFMMKPKENVDAKEWLYDLYLEQDEKQMKREEK